MLDRVACGSDECGEIIRLDSDRHACTRPDKRKKRKQAQGRHRATRDAARVAPLVHQHRAARGRAAACDERAARHTRADTAVADDRHRTLTDHDGRSPRLITTADHRSVRAFDGVGLVGPVRMSEPRGGRPASWTAPAGPRPGRACVGGTVARAARSHAPSTSLGQPRHPRIQRSQRGFVGHVGGAASARSC